MKKSNSIQKRVFWSYVVICAITALLYGFTSQVDDGHSKTLFGYFSLLSNVTTILGLPYLLFNLVKDKPL
jgi:hypothetical protein